MTLSQFTARLSYATIPLFWPIWIATAAAAIYLAYRFNPRWLSGEPLRSRHSLLVVALLVPYALFLVWGEDFAYHDNDVFTEHIAAGKWWPLSIWPHEGRYFPLFAQEFNFLGLVAPAPLLFHGFAAIQLLAFCWLVGLALGGVSLPWRIGAAVVLSLSNSVGIVFADLIYPERNAVLCLAALIVAIDRTGRAPSRLTGIVALLAAHLTLYFKEPLVLFIGTFATVRLLVASSRLQGGGRSLPAVWLELGLLGLCSVFLVQFIVSLLAFQSSSYVTRAAVGPVAAAMRYFRTDMLLGPFIAVAIVRMIHLRRIADVDPLWDALAAAALVYFCALVVLGLAAARYLPPVDLIAVLYTARQMAHWCQANRVKRWVVIPAAAVIVLATTVFGAVRLLEYKSVIWGTVGLTEFINTYAATRSGEIRLYFPTSRNWRIMNAAAHLHFRHPELSGRIRFVAPLVFPDGRCVAYLHYRCDTDAQARPMDVVVQLADDTSRSDVADRELIYRYEPLPGGVPRALGRLVYPEAELYEGEQMPDGWLSTTAAVLR